MCQCVGWTSEGHPAYIDAPRKDRLMSKRNIALVAIVAALVAVIVVPALANLAAGTKAPDFTLPTAAGKTFKMSDSFKAPGKVVVLDIWATWCPPCRAEIPYLIDLQNKFKNKNVLIVGVALDQGKTTVTDFIAKQKINYTILLDPNGNKLATPYKIEGIPATYIIDKTGVIRYVHSGFPTGDKAAQKEEAAAIEREVNTLLAAK